MPSYSDETKINVLEISDKTTLTLLKDGSGNLLRNVMEAYTFKDLSGGVADGIMIKIALAGAPTSGSGTKFAAYLPGSRAVNMATGRWYTKTSEVGATDVWVIEGAASYGISDVTGLTAALAAKMATADYPDLVAIEAVTGTGTLQRTDDDPITWSLNAGT
jgi:hypothetical protein